MYTETQQILTDELTFANMLEMLTRMRSTHQQLAKSNDLAEKRKRIAQIDNQLKQGWDKVPNASQLQQERSRLQLVTETLDQVGVRLVELEQLLDLAKEEKDEEMLLDIAKQSDQVRKQLAQQEMARLLAIPNAQADTYLDVQFGSGGVESQDWAQMLKRMYLGYAAYQSWKANIIEETPGEAGIKSVTLLFKGNNAYGILRTETGVHRLVRKSPFDSNHRRHTSFASVFVYPVLPASEAVEINSSDLRVDTYRSSGSGGQHVNTTDSAVRITHLPTGIVVQSQNDRSQHKNRATAMSMLSSRLKLLQRAKEEQEKKKVEQSKADISWGSQIRSYVLDQSRIKDLRTGVETGNVQGVLNGPGLERFIEASLRSKL